MQLPTKLAEEKSRLEDRLQEINRVLGGEIPAPFRTKKPAAAKSLRLAKLFGLSRGVIFNRFISTLGG